MKLCTAVQEGCGYKNTLSAHRYFAPLAKYFTVCITYQPPLVSVSFGRMWWHSWLMHCATSQKIMGLIPDGVIGIFH
jgi:hypothetical protein